MKLRAVVSLVRGALVCSAISTVAFACIPLCDIADESTERIVSYALAGVFWAALIAEQILFWIANAGRRRAQKKAFGKNSKARAGIFTFFSSREASAVDLLLGVSLILTVVIILFRLQVDWLVTVTLATLLLSFRLHCILNGKTYRYIKVGTQKEKEPKRNESRNKADR